MVSKAREDLPEPDRPVITVKRSRGMSTLMFLRLCWRAPLTLMRSMAIAKISYCSQLIFARQAIHRFHRLINEICVICGLEVEAHPEFHATRRLSGSRLSEERRGFDSGKSAEIRVVQEVECLRVELEAILLR